MKNNNNTATMLSNINLQLFTQSSEHDGMLLYCHNF